MTREVMERMLWLSLLEKPWDEARLAIRDELDRLGMTHEDLLFGMRRSGFTVARSTLGAWLRGEGKRAQGPPVEGLRAIVAVVARVGMGDSAKPDILSSGGLAYAPGLAPVGDQADSHAQHHRHRNSESQVPVSRNGPKGLSDFPHAGDIADFIPLGGALLLHPTVPRSSPPC